MIRNFLKKSLFSRKLESKGIGIFGRNLGFREFSNNEKRENILINQDDLEWKFIRGGGKGGQKTNKTANCVFLRHLPTNITVKCHKSRDRETNKHYAIKRLKERLDLEVNGKMAKKKVKQEKKRRNKSRNKRRSRLKHQNNQKGSSK